MKLSGDAKDAPHARAGCPLKPLRAAVTKSPHGGHASGTSDDGKASATRRKLMFAGSNEEAADVERKNYPTGDGRYSGGRLVCQSVAL